MHARLAGGMRCPLPRSLLVVSRVMSVKYVEFSSDTKSVSDHATRRTCRPNTLCIIYGWNSKMSERAIQQSTTSLKICNTILNLCNEMYFFFKFYNPKNFKIWLDLNTQDTVSRSPGKISGSIGISFSRLDSPAISCMP